MALLTRHRANADDRARQAEATVPGDAYVLSHALDGSQPFRPDNVTGCFTRVRDSLGPHEVRLHDLRHFTATQLIGAVSAGELWRVALATPIRPSPLLSALANVGQSGNRFPQARETGLSPP